jgi:hypothetical protein
VGILATAQKKGLEDEHKDIAANSMIILMMLIMLSEMEEVTIY